MIIVLKSYKEYKTPKKGEYGPLKIPEVVSGAQEKQTPPVKRYIERTYANEKQIKDGINGNKMVAERDDDEQVINLIVLLRIQN